MYIHVHCTDFCHKIKTLWHTHGYVGKQVHCTYFCNIIKPSSHVASILMCV
jgi:hypothetical protein